MQTLQEIFEDKTFIEMDNKDSVTSKIADANLKHQPLTEKLDALLRLGYMANMIRMINGATFIKISGYNRKYFKAKQKKANTITANLNRLPFISVAWDKLDYDGFYQFYAK